MTRRVGDELPDAAYEPLRGPIPGGAPMTVEQAARLVIRHHDMYGAAGLAAAINVLRRAVERHHGPDPGGSVIGRRLEDTK